MSIRYRKIINNNVKLPGLNHYQAVEIVGSDIYELKFNPYNDRFAMQNKEYEHQYKKELGLDVNSQDYIFKELLLKDKPQKNKITKDDILKKGVLKNIVVDNNGIIIDGNRRIAILRQIIDEHLKLKLGDDRLTEFKEPKLVLIKGNLTKFQIRNIETILQISEDEKVPYDPINMYIKIDRLYHERKNKSMYKDDAKIYEEISNLLGPKHKKSDVKTSHNVFKVMEDYLKFFNRYGEYTYLQHKEDHFKQISSFLTSAENDKINFSKLSDDKDDNIFQIKKILFDLTCAHIEGKIFRKIVPKSQKSKSSLLYSHGLKTIKNYINKNLKKNGQTIYSKTSREKADESIKVINETFLWYKNKTDHLDANESIIKKLEQNIKNLDDWYSQIKSPYRKNKKFEKQIYKCINRLTRFIKGYGDNSEI